MKYYGPLPTFPNSDVHLDTKSLNCEGKYFSFEIQAQGSKGIQSGFYSVWGAGSRDDTETAGCQEACGENKSPHVTLSTHEVKGKNGKASVGWDEEVRRRRWSGPVSAIGASGSSSERDNTDPSEGTPASCLYTLKSSEKQVASYNSHRKGVQLSFPYWGQVTLTWSGNYEDALTRPLIQEQLMLLQETFVSQRPDQASKIFRRVSTTSTTMKILSNHTALHNYKKITVRGLKSKIAHLSYV